MFDRVCGSQWSSSVFIIHVDGDDDDNLRDRTVLVKNDKHTEDSRRRWRRLTPGGPVCPSIQSAAAARGSWGVQAGQSRLEGLVSEDELVELKAVLDTIHQQYNAHLNSFVALLPAQVSATRPLPPRACLRSPLLPAPLRPDAPPLP